METSSSYTTHSDEKRKDVLVKKIHRFLGSKFDQDKETADILSELSSVFTTNTLQNRRNLRSLLEQQNLSISKEFQSNFDHVIDALNKVHTDASEIMRSCSDMNARLQKTKVETQQLIDQTSSLQSKCQKVKMHQQIAESFLNEFKLTEHEINLLKGSPRGHSPASNADEISLDFFSTLDKVKAIHSKCKLLLEENIKEAGLEIMEQMAAYQESGMEHLYRWTQAHCKSKGKDIASDALLPKALSKLQERPALFKYIMNEYCCNCRSLMASNFINVLTNGDESLDLKPIELESQNPPKYVTDMLAWIYQSVCTEREQLQRLLDLCDQIDVSDNISHCLANITEGVCSPLKSRIDQQFSTQQNLNITCKISGILHFYVRTFSQALPVSTSSLVMCLVELHENSQQMIKSIVHNQVRIIRSKNISTNNNQPYNDLLPSNAVSQLMELIREYLSCATSPIASTLDENSMEIYEFLMSVLLEMVDESGANLTTTDMSVYLLNCYHQINSVLGLFEFTKNRIDNIQVKMDGLVDTLCSENSSCMVAQLSLGNIYTILCDHNNSRNADDGAQKEPLCRTPGLDYQSLKSFIDHFYNQIQFVDKLMLPQLFMLNSVQYRRIIRRRSSELLCVIYSQLYKAVHDETNQYPNPSELLSLSQEQVKSLLFMAP